MLDQQTAVKPRIIRLNQSKPLEASPRLITPATMVQGARLIIPSSAMRGEVTEAEIHDALDRRHFTPMYQAEHELTEHPKVCGYEALGRWMSPHRGVLQPAQFFPALQTSRDKTLLARVNWQIVEEAARQYSAARRKGRLHGSPELSINLSCKALTEAFVQKLADLLTGLDLAPTSIAVELWAQELDDAPQLEAGLRALREAGVRVTVDGFNLKSCSLYLLAHSLASQVKLGRSFVAAVPGRSREAVVLDHLMRMTSDLGITVLANGIEAVNQLNALREAGLDRGQGFLLSKPVEALAA